MEKDSKIFVAGHRGLVGSAILNNLRSKGYTNFLLRTHAELDLTDQAAVNEFFAAERPDYVFLSAAHVGGIMANSLYRADFIYNNLMIQNNVIHASWKNDVKKLLFLGSTCIYPREAPQPMPEDCLLTSPLEYSNEPYAIAKIAGIKMCESYNLQYGTNYIAVMPTNLYGPNDNFNLETSHVLPAMIRKIHLAKCLHTGDWEALRKDMDIRPVEGVSGKASEPEILSVLDKQGICPDTFDPESAKTIASEVQQTDLALELFVLAVYQHNEQNHQIPQTLIEECGMYLNVIGTFHNMCCHILGNIPAAHRFDGKPHCQEIIRIFSEHFTVHEIAPTPDGLS